MKNIDTKTVDGFGEEWELYNQKNFNGTEYEFLAKTYFNLFPFDRIDHSSEGFDMGCGSGRWARYLAPKVGLLNCIDPSKKALEVAKSNLANSLNCSFECAGVSDTSLQPASQDFGYSLGVLHHIPDTALGINACSELLKPGAPFILYLYYKFDDKPKWFRFIWKLSDYLRILISRLPFQLKKSVCYLIALFIYLPLSRLSKYLNKAGFNVSNIPLSTYRNQPFYTLATDALDRFGTKLEQRFTKSEIIKMMHDAGFENIEFNDPDPGWICVGYKKSVK
jgi:SAM-dependent methyltransferase